MAKPQKAQSSLSGWLTAKKRGRDDKQIEKDRNRALAARKRRNVAATKRKPARKRQEEYSESEESEDGSIDDFIVDDDEEEEELQVNSSEDESGELEVVGVKEPIRKLIPRGAKSTAQTKRVTPDDSSSDEDGTTFFQSYKARPSVPSKPLQRASIATKSRRLPSLALSTSKPRSSVVDLTAPALKKKATVPARKDVLILDDSEDLTSPSPMKPSTKSNTLGRRTTRLPYDFDDSDSSIDGGNAKNPRVVSRHFITGADKPGTSGADSKARVMAKGKKSSSTILDSPEPTKTSTLTENAKRQRNSFSDSDSDSMVKQTRPRSVLDDTPELARKKPKTLRTKKNPFTRFQNPAVSHSGSPEHVITNDDDDGRTLTSDSERSDMQRAIRASKKDVQRKARNGINVEDDSSMDEDERLAVEQAIKESKREVGRQKYPKMNESLAKEKSSEDKQQTLLDEILAESSEGEPEDQGEDYDEEREAANSVLNTAEQLSAEVLRTMTEWASQDDNVKTENKTSATQGMIVDGALSLGTLADVSTSSTAKSSHKWISQDVMQQACPGVKLSNYQLIGVNWLALLHGMKCNIDGKGTPVNGVLADEMGLGKTVQTIAFLAWLRHQRKELAKNNRSEPVSPHLIVVPVSVLPNWVREFKTFCPEMNVVKYHGSLADREYLQDELRQYLTRGGSSDRTLDVILAPVTYFQKEKSDDRRFLNKFRFDYLVVDEAHMLKNSQSTRYKMLERVSTKHRLLLTGTPVQNSPQELLNMLCFIMPLFSRGSDSLEEDTSNVGDRMLQHFVDAETEKIGEEAAAYKKLKHLFAPFVLRRKKEDVIAQLLPPKEHVVEMVDLDPTARSIYDSILEDHVSEKGKKITAAIGEHLFTNLRKAAHHPLLLRSRHKSEAEVEHLTTHFHKYGAFQGEGSTKARVGEELSQFNDFLIHLTALELIDVNPHRRADLERYILDEDALYSSSKFSRLRTLLPKLISQSHRVLIFSGWTSCLDLLGCLMEHLGLNYLRMDGSSPSDERQAMIDQFNNDSSIHVFLLSTRACGLGINLTAADTCILHDLDFNPFNDLQAEDRCHRIGQKKKVTVYKLVAKDTVDSAIYEMQERKSKMNAAIMESGEAKKERKVMLQSAVDRFLETPKAKVVPNVANKENNDVICLI